MANGKNGNGNGNGNKPVVGKKPTQEDLLKAASDATRAAGDLLEAATSSPEDEEDTDLPDITALHGEGQRPQPVGNPPAFEEFMARLKRVLDKAGDTVTVTDRAAWVKIESRRNGHKVYIAKGKTAVSRVESTLPPSAVTGATEPGRPNGRIASWIPADPGSVSEAIAMLATSDMAIRPPVRTRGGTPPARGGGSPGPGGAGGGRRRGLMN